MKLQKKVLDQYLELFGRPTLKEISNGTGIQLTRVFRLLNGRPMKLFEYEIFENLVNEKLNLINGPCYLAKKCERSFSKKGVENIKSHLSRRLRMRLLLDQQLSNI